jgi:hypothetical protein
LCPKISSSKPINYKAHISIRRKDREAIQKKMGKEYEKSSQRGRNPRTASIYKDVNVT